MPELHTQLAPASERLARVNHPKQHALGSASYAFTRALDLLFPRLKEYPGRKQSLLQTFERAAWSSICSWRTGHRKPPQWARMILADRLRQLGNSAFEIAKILEKEKADQ